MTDVIYEAEQLTISKHLNLPCKFELLFYFSIILLFTNFVFCQFKILCLFPLFPLIGVLLLFFRLYIRYYLSQLTVIQTQNVQGQNLSDTQLYIF